MEKVQIIIDTNVFISALRNDTGASFYLLSLIGKNVFENNISVPLIMEYESVAHSFLRQTNLTVPDLNDILDYICSASNRHNFAQELKTYTWKAENTRKKRKKIKLLVDPTDICGYRKKRLII